MRARVTSADCIVQRPAQPALLSPGAARPLRSPRVCARRAEAVLQLASHKHEHVATKSFLLSEFLSRISHLPSEAAMSVPPPFSEEQLAWLRSQFATTTTPADPPAEDPPPGDGSSDNGKLNVEGPIVIYVKPKAYPNRAILYTAWPILLKLS